jgi:hypothetical protein
MNTGNLKNIVVLKDLPSNLIEEAIVVLKENQKIPKLEPASKDKKENESDMKKNSKDYIVKEAQMLIADYISRVENKNKKENQSIQKLNKKCKWLKSVNQALLVSLVISILINFIF